MANTKKTNTAAKGNARQSNKYVPKKSASNKAVAKTKTKAKANYNQGKRITKRRSSTKKPSAPKPKQIKALPISVTFLGGLNEVGKNITVYEYDNEIIIVDCGLKFPDSSMFGVDAVLPDFSYLIENADKIKGIIITHGHEDHIGGLAYLLKEINVPVYGTKLTIGLIEYKLKEHGIDKTCKLNVIKAGSSISIGKFNIEFIHVNHSIPDAVALAIKTDAGTIVQTGDFKIDNTPIDGQVIDLPRFVELGNEGVLALLQDSTNAEKEGYTLSESKVGETFETLFRNAKNKRIIVATFASNVHRIQQIMNAARSLGRKVAVMGRSMENIVKLGQELGYLKIPKRLMIEEKDIGNYSYDKLVIITTGSQGEPMAALSKMALSEHRSVEIGPSDYVIISATPIPGNEKGVGNVVNALMMHGADVIYENFYRTHVSGHACQEELKMMINLIKPKYFIPVHGEHKHLRKHAALAVEMGMLNKNIIIADNGDKIIFDEGALSGKEKVNTGVTLVDGTGVGDIGSIVLRDRERLASAGMISIAATVDLISREIVTGPQIISRGFVFVKENEELMEMALSAAEKDMDKFLRSNSYDLNALSAQIRDDISQIMYRQTKRNPMILPIIMEV